MSETGKEMHMVAGTVDIPRSQLPFEARCPGAGALDARQKVYR